MKNRRCFVDTSAFVALNNPNDQHYKDAIGIAETLDQYQFVLSDAVISETYSLLRYRLGYHSARRFLANVIEHDQFKVIDVTSNARQDALSLLEKFSDQRISYCDALSVALMNINNIDTIFSFDHHFELMGVSRFY